ncbi:MAG TPA: RNA polymerase sigma-70 factor [Prolixibacteraceae bacterium]|nr:RNA polymerase sigma-70 factor [Prolixibacteraceae bacterium]
MAHNDTILIKLLKDGNINVFESVYSRYYGPLFTFCNQYIDNKEAAKELVQDLFLMLWEGKEKLNKDTNLRSYLYHVARNNCLNYLKHLKVQEKYLQYSKRQKLEIELNQVALNNFFPEKIYIEELEMRINDSVQSLPPRCKYIFELSRYHEKKYTEIATELNISVKTVENQIQKALKILRKNLAGYGKLLFLATLNFL